MGVDIASDDLSFFPLLYWPMDPRERICRRRRISKLADYMRNGGTILFDTRDLTLGAVRGANSPGEQTLRRLPRSSTCRRWSRSRRSCADEVVLSAAGFSRPLGRRAGLGGSAAAARSRCRTEPARGGDGVSPVIIGGNDWAAAWAVDAIGPPLVDVSPGGEEQREMALRFGINVVMYALTGNYKTDQVHVPALLERLGK